MLRILGRASSINVRKVLWTCREIGLDYRREDFGTGFAPTNTPQFLAMNPNGQVPVIEDEAGVLWESNTICRYLAAKHARTDLLSADPRERAGVEQWMDWGATDLNSAWRYAFTGARVRAEFHIENGPREEGLPRKTRHVRNRRPYHLRQIYLHLCQPAQSQSLRRGDGQMRNERHARI